MASGSTNSGNLSAGFESLNLGEMGLPPPSAAGRETGAVPKATSTNLEKCSSTSSVTVAGTAKKRRNRRQRRRRTMDDNGMAGKGRDQDGKEKGGDGAAVAAVAAVAAAAAAGAASSSSPPTDLTMLEGGAGRQVLGMQVEGEEVIAQQFLEALKEEDLKVDPLEAEAEEEKVPSAASAGTPQPARRAGARRRRRKRKKQRSPDKLSDKENKFVEPKSDGDDDEEEEDAEGAAAGGGERHKFVWRNVMKSGAVKKCVLAEGRAEKGRPTVGDTVLVRSQGKLRDGTIVDDHSTLVFNVGEHEVIEGLDVAVRSMHKSELAIVSVKPEAAYGDLGRKGDIPPGSRITYLFGLMHFEKQKEVSANSERERRCGNVQTVM